MLNKLFDRPAAPSRRSRLSRCRLARGRGRTATHLPPVRRRQRPAAAMGRCRAGAGTRPDPSYDLTPDRGHAARCCRPTRRSSPGWRPCGGRRSTLARTSGCRRAARSVMARAQRDAGPARDPLAWFDAGYLVESYRQASHIYKWNMLEGRAKTDWKLRDRAGRRRRVRDGAQGAAGWRRERRDGIRGLADEEAVAARSIAAVPRPALQRDRCSRETSRTTEQSPPGRGRAMPRPRSCRPRDRPISGVSPTPSRESTRHRGFKLPVLIYIRCRDAFGSGRVPAPRTSSIARRRR